MQWIKFDKDDRSTWPERGIRVAVMGETHRGGEWASAALFNINHIGKPTWTVRYFDGINYGNATPTHWMPLPPKPKEDE